MAIISVVPAAVAESDTSGSQYHDQASQFVTRQEILEASSRFRAVTPHAYPSPDIQPLDIQEVRTLSQQEIGGGSAALVTSVISLDEFSTQSPGSDSMAGQVLGSIQDGEYRVAYAALKSIEDIEVQALLAQTLRQAILREYDDLIAAERYGAAFHLSLATAEMAAGREIAERLQTALNTLHEDITLQERFISRQTKLVDTLYFEKQYEDCITELAFLEVLDPSNDVIVQYKSALAPYISEENNQ